MSALKLRPHHLLDIISSYGEGREASTHPWGASVISVTDKVLSDINQNFKVAYQIDSICETCEMLVDGICQAKLGNRGLMRDYNDALDSKLLAEMNLKDGEEITIRDFLLSVKMNLDNLIEMYDQPPEHKATRKKFTENALSKLGISGT